MHTIYTMYIFTNKYIYVCSIKIYTEYIICMHIYIYDTYNMYRHTCIPILYTDIHIYSCKHDGCVHTLCVYVCVLRN